jgi:hypothetical protein
VLPDQESGFWPNFLTRVENPVANLRGNNPSHEFFWPFSGCGNYFLHQSQSRSNGAAEKRFALGELAAARKSETLT